MREPNRLRGWYSIFWLSALAALVFYLLGKEELAEAGVGAAAVALAWALVFDHRRRSK